MRPLTGWHWQPESGFVLLLLMQGRGRWKLMLSGAAWSPELCGWQLSFFATVDLKSKWLSNELLDSLPAQDSAIPYQRTMSEERHYFTHLKSIRFTSVHLLIYSRVRTSALPVRSSGILQNSGVKIEATMLFHAIAENCSGCHYRFKGFERYRLSKSSFIQYPQAACVKPNDWAD